MARKKHHEPEPLPAVPMPELPLRDPANEQPANEQQDVYTVAEVAKRWKVDRHTVTAAILEERLPAFKVRHRGWRIRKEDVLAFERQNVAAAS